MWTIPNLFIFTKSSGFWYFQRVKKEASGMEKVNQLLPGIIFIPPENIKKTMVFWCF